jgi:ABC-2 type transport system permease protein
MSTAIHDIGYRHYDGPRFGRAYVVRSMFVYNLRAIFGIGRPAKTKILPFLLAAFLLIPAAGDVAVLAFVKQPEALIQYSSYAMLLSPLIAIFLATQAPVAASRELRYKTVPLYFSRPVGTTDFVLAKFGAFTTALFLLLATPVTLLHLGFILTRSGMVDQMKLFALNGEGEVETVPTVLHQTGLFLGALVGCLLYALVLSAFALVIAAFTPRRGFGVAAVIAVYLISNVMVLIVQGIAIDSSNYDVAGWAGLFTPFNLVDGVQVRLLGAPQASTPQAPPDGIGGPVFLLACIGVVVGSLAILLARFRKAGQ